MKPAPFDYYAPTTIDEALALLHRYGEDAKILAGGQSLVPLMNFRLVRPRVLVDINRIPGLAGIAEDNGSLVFGALTREADIGASSLVAHCNPLLTEATRWIGHEAIRSRGTIGGSLVHNDPTGEYPLVATLLDAEITARSTRATRTIPMADFSLGLLTTSLAPDELVVGVRIRKLRNGTGWAFLEVARRRGDFAIVNVAATLRLGGGVVQDARIAVGGAGPAAFRAREAEDVLHGERLTAAVVEEAGRRAARAAEPADDIHGSADYRRHLVRVLTERAIWEAKRRADH